MKILIIDDEQEVRRLASLALGRLGGHDILECDNGADGVHVAAEHRPDLILLDVTMPTMDGPSTLKALRRDPRTADIPVIFLTAKAIESDVERFRGLGAIATLTKPFDPVRLDQDVRTSLGRTA